MANILIDELSLTISELVDLDLEQQNLIESAITRAISAKDVVGGLYKDVVGDHHLCGMVCDHNYL